MGSEMRILGVVVGMGKRKGGECVKGGAWVIL